MTALALSLTLSLLMAVTASGEELGANGTRARSPRPAKAAAASKPAGQRNAGVAAIVRTDGAMVYSKADFDADVLGNLRRGDRVRVSSGTIGDYAKFHKVAAGAIVGWIADIDVQVEGASKKRDHKRGSSKKSRGRDREKKPFVDESLPIFFTKYVGVLVGATEFNEDISGVDSKETLLVYGLKFTGPDLLLTGPVLDLNLALHYGAPSYYTPLSSTKPSGFLIYGDALLLYPFFNRDKAMITFGLGPLLKFSTFNVTSGGEIKSLSRLDFGASIALAGAVKVGKFAVRLEGKYHLEKKSEKMALLSIQQQF